VILQLFLLYSQLLLPLFESFLMLFKLFLFFLQFSFSYVGVHLFDVNMYLSLMRLLAHTSWNASIYRKCVDFDSIAFIAFSL
jgi:hypothetical protein